MTVSEWVSILTQHSIVGVESPDGAVRRKPAYMNGALQYIDTNGKGQLATHDRSEAPRLLLLQDYQADQEHVADLAPEDLLYRLRNVTDGGGGPLRTYCRIVRVRWEGKEEW